MESYIRNDAEFRRLYNCSFYNVSEISLEHRVNIPLGVSIMTVSIIQLILYIPCLCSMILHFDNSCYKIMFFMGVLDSLNLFVMGVMDGWYSIKGAVYCASPDILYIKGSLMMSLWLGETSTEVMLAINRCINFVSENWADRLFGSARWGTGYKTWLWMIIPTCWGLFYFFFGTTAIFSSLVHIETFNAHFGYANEMANDYTFKLYDIHNAFIAISIPSVYGIFTCVLISEFRSVLFPTDANFRSQRQFSEKRVFIQTTLIASVNFSVAMVAISAEMGWHTINEWTSTLHLFLYIEAHGLPPVFYLLLNKAIRRDINSFGMKIYDQVNKCIHPNAAAHRQSNVAGSRGTHATAVQVIANHHQEHVQNTLPQATARPNQIAPRQAF